MSSLCHTSVSIDGNCAGSHGDPKQSKGLVELEVFASSDSRTTLSSGDAHLVAHVRALLGRTACTVDLVTYSFTNTYLPIRLTFPRLSAILFPPPATPWGFTLSFNGRALTENHQHVLTLHLPNTLACFGSIDAGAELKQV